jgi:fatty-acid desaturase
MNSLKNQKNHRYQPGNMKITSDLTNLTTAILILTVQMFFEWTLCALFLKYVISNLISINVHFHLSLVLGILIICFDKLIYVNLDL